MVTFGPLEAAEIAAILRALRAADRREAEATLGPFDPAELAARIAASAFAGFVARSGASAVASVSLHPIVPGVLGATMVATEDWPRVAAAVTRRVRRALMPELAAAGIRRVEARSIAGHDAAHRWLRWLGARCEGEMESFGQGGETFLLFAWRPQPER